MNVIAGPCAIESQEQILETAKFLKSLGMTWIKGGGYKPLTYGPGHRQEYQKSLGQNVGTSYLHTAREMCELKTLSEFVDIEDDFWADRVQIGARNMQNFTLLNQVEGSSVLLKRHFGCSLEELYAATTYFPTDHDLWVCERGVVVPHQHGYRYLLDFQAVLEWKRIHPLIPIYVDISHWMGSKWAECMSWNVEEIVCMIISMAQLAKTAEADGILVDIHQNPAEAWVDPYQALTFPEFERLLNEVN